MPSAGPSVSFTPKNDSSRFGHLREMLEEEVSDSDSGSCSSHSTYDFNYDSVGDNTIASTMLSIFATGGKKKPKMKKGKGKAIMPGPKMTTSSGVSQTTIQYQMNVLEKAYADESDDELDMPQDMAEKIVGMAVIKFMDGQFAKLYSKIDILKTEVLMVKTTVARLGKENN
jgi:hypothetical protein